MTPFLCPINEEKLVDLVIFFSGKISPANHLFSCETDELIKHFVPNVIISVSQLNELASLDKKITTVFTTLR